MNSEGVTVYNRHTAFNKKGKPAIIRIDANGRNARIQISVEAVKLLRLKEGDAMSFITLKHDRENIYFFIDPEGIPVKVANEHKSGVDMGIYCRQLARKLLDHLGITSMRSFIVTGANIDCQGRKCFVIDKYRTYVGKYKPNGKINKRVPPFDT